MLAIAYPAVMRKVPAIVVKGSPVPFNRHRIKFYRADGEIIKNDETDMLNKPMHLQEAWTLDPLPEVMLVVG